MNNKLRESEMFVIIPARWADNLLAIIGEVPDVKGIYEATRPEDSPYWQRQKAKAERAASDRGAQAESVGMGKFLRGIKGDDKHGSLLSRLFKRS